MTGRDFIVYILENHLEDENIFKDGRFLGCLTSEEAAVKFGVSSATIDAWVSLGMLDGLTIKEDTYIPFNAELMPNNLSREE